MLVRALARRQRGEEGHGRLEAMELTRRTLAMHVSVDKDVQPVHTRTVSAMQVDGTEQRYLLSAGNDRKIVRQCISVKMIQFAVF